MIVSCSSDTTLKAWKAFSSGECVRTFRQHSDYVTSLAAAKDSNILASGGLGCEVFLWDLEAALIPVSRAANDGTVEGGYEGIHSSGGSGGIVLTDRATSTNSSSFGTINTSQGYSPVPAKGHKESVYALAINDAGTVLVSGGTEKVIRVWDPRSGTKQMKLKGHTDNVRTLLLDSSGRLCISGSSDSTIRLWDLGQQRCVHSYAVHTDSVWALASPPSFSHVYSGGRDLSVYLTDLSSRESTLLCTEQQHVLQLALQDDEWLWVATPDSSLHRWPARSSLKTLQKGSSFVAGSLPYARARASLDGSAPVPLHAEPAFVIPGTPGILQHAVLNDRRHLLTKDAVGIVKLWEITRGAVVTDFGKVSFEEKEKELFEMVSVPAWFTIDTRLGSISVHLDTPQCFGAEIYAVDLQVTGASEETKLNLGQQTLRGLLAHWIACRKQKASPQEADGDLLAGAGSGTAEHGLGRGAVDDGASHSPGVFPAFEFENELPPSIITEGSQGGPWRKKATELDGTEDEKELPWWCIDAVLNGKLPPREHAKCSFFLQPYEGTSLQVLTQGKLSAPRILRIQKVMNYVLDKLAVDKLDKSVDDGGSVLTSTSVHMLSQNSSGNGHTSSKSGSRVWQHQSKLQIEILCNHQVLPPVMSLATVRAYVWKKPEDLCLQYRTIPE
ncbi:hypothetical protein O6H91_11G042000 [Diphasiastrum complanatum]|nr:hypothetical protein O6H91_11G042000 [Diphasiastrum complanatum]